MIKSELIEKLAEANPHLYQRDVERVVNTVLAEESDALGHVIATMTMVEDPEPSAGAPAALPQHAAGRTDRPMPKRSFPWERPAELLIDTGVFQS